MLSTHSAKSQATPGLGIESQNTVHDFSGHRHCFIVDSTVNSRPCTAKQGGYVHAFGGDRKYDETLTERAMCAQISSTDLRVQTPKWLQGTGGSGGLDGAAQLALTYSLGS